jgi:flagellar L-ring protein precursor FlgH
MKQMLALSSLSLLLFLSGCSTHYADPKIDMKPPRYVEELPSKDNGNLQPNQGSLFGKGDNPLFSDRKAMRVNDIVTVVVSEATAQSSSGTKKLNEANTAQLGGGVLASATATPNIVSRGLNKLNGYTDISYNSNSTSSYSGSGTVKRDESFNTTVSARIVKILNNGNYFISGRRELLINGEKQDIRIAGVIRPYDIDQYNSIDSKYIADAKISYVTQGDIDANTRKGWGSKAIESVWPF